MKKSEKIILLIMLLIILAGIVVLCICGFNKSFEYYAHKRIEVYIPNGYEETDIMSIAKECFGTENIKFTEVEKLKQIAGIKISEYSEEELENYKNKIMEKYEIDSEDLQIYEIDVPESRISTLINPYIFPVVLSTILCLIYFTIRNIKNKNVWQELLKVICTITLVAGLFFSIIVLTRIPFNAYIMPFAVLVYILTLLFIIKKK